MSSASQCAHLSHWLQRVWAWLTTPASPVPNSSWPPLLALALAVAASILIPRATVLLWGALQRGPVLRPVTDALLDLLGTSGYTAFLILLGDVVTILIVVALVSRHGGICDGFRLKFPSVWWHMIVGPLVLFVAQVIALVIFDLLVDMPASPAKRATPPLPIAGAESWLLNARDNVLAPVWEEMLFRGFLFTALAQSRLGLWGGALISSAVFGLIHVQYPVAQQIELGIAGVTYCLALYKSGSIWPGVVAHVMWNVAVGLAKGTG